MNERCKEHQKTDVAKRWANTQGYCETSSQLAEKGDELTQAQKKSGNELAKTRKNKHGHKQEREKDLGKNESSTKRKSKTDELSDHKLR